MISNPIRLLLVEDNDGDAILQQALLAGHAPGEFTTVRVDRLAHAMERFDSEHFDAVLSDLSLPDSVGLDTVHALVARAPALPLVVLTGSSDEQLGLAAILHGAQDFLVKDEATGAMIARTLRHAVERKRFEVGLKQANETLESRVAERTATLETALRSVRESEERYRAVSQSASDAIVTIDAAGDIVGWNRGATAIFGYTNEEIEGQPLTRLMPPRFHEAHCAGLRHVLSGGAPRHYGKTLELYGLRKGAGEFPLELTLSGWEVGGVRFFTGVIRDITERRANEAKIKRLSNLYAALSECNQAIVRCADESELFSQVCRAAVQLGGMKCALIWMGGSGSRGVRQVASFGANVLADCAAWDEIVADSSLGMGPIVSVMRENRTAWCPEEPHDPLVAEWQQHLGDSGHRAIAALPLRRGGAAAGVFIVFADESNTFDPAARNLLEEMAVDISFALDNFVREASRRQAEEMLRQSENRFRDLYERAPLAYQSLDIEGNILEVNEAWLALFDRSRDEVSGRFIGEFLTEASVATLSGEFPRFKQTGRVDGPVFEFIRKDGGRRLVRVNGQIARDNQGNFLRTHCILTDITEVLRAEAQRKLAADVFDQSTEGIMITDRECNIVSVNCAFSEITGYGSEEVVGKNPRILSSGRQDQEFYRLMWESVNANGKWQGEISNRRKDGSVYPEWLSIGRVLDGDGTVTHYIGTFSDLTQRKAAEEHIDWLAHFDALTGLPNRILASDRTRHSISMVQRSGEPLALMVVDLDHFKNINDSLGHEVGDTILAAFARRLTQELREQDIVSRLGSDEFMLVLPGTDAGGAAHLARKLSEAISRPYRLNQDELIITASIGIAMYPSDASDFETLSKCADVAVQRAKLDGRNGCRFFTAEMQTHSARRVRLESELHRALERNELSLHYQPQFSLPTGAMIGAEALLRWKHSEMGMVSPAEFIPIAESSGQILPIGEWVLRSAVRQWKRWLDSGLAAMPIAVNLSAVQFKHPHLIDLVMRILDEEQLDAKYLILELTEGVAMDDPLAAIEVMESLHRHGVRLSIDDFGTGYSSLSYLKRFKVSKLKIDQSFVRDFAEDHEGKAIISAIISLAGNLGLQTVAEGVETAEQAAFLRDKGCDEVQGYYFSKPLASEQFEAFAGVKTQERDC